MADLFEDEIGSDHNSPESNDWQKLQNAMKKEGYRQGLAAGQEMNIQQGFNSGYSDAYGTTFQLATIRGILCAVVGHHLKGGETFILSEAELSLIESLIQQISDLEKSILTKTVLQDDSAEGQVEGGENKEAPSVPGVILDDVNVSVNQQKDVCKNTDKDSATCSSTKDTGTEIESQAKNDARKSSSKRKVICAQNNLARMFDKEIKEVTLASENILQKLGLANLSTIF